MDFDNYAAQRFGINQALQAEIKLNFGLETKKFNLKTRYDTVTKSADEVKLRYLSIVRA